MVGDHLLKMRNAAAEALFDVEVALGVHPDPLRKEVYALRVKLAEIVDRGVKREQKRHASLRQGKERGEP